MKIIKLVNRPSFGHERLYPICETAKRITKLLKRTCLPREHVELLENMGHTVEIEQPPEKQKPEL